MRRSIALLLFLIFPCLLQIERAKAQGPAGSLQPGIPIERTIGRGQTHSFNVNLEEDQVLQLVVDQRGIDVVVRVFAPAGKSVGEFDSPNGDDGPENVSLLAATTGIYRIDVAPLDQGGDPPSGRYEIKVLEIRRATEQELQAGKNQLALKARGLALLAEVAESLQQMRLPQTRVRAQLQAAQLLWNSDEKLAENLLTDAMEGVKEYLAKVDPGYPDYYQYYASAMQLRHEVLQVLGPHDPEKALSFLRSTRVLSSPEEGQENNQLNQELQFEISLANQITAKDPKRSLQIAEDTLKNGYPANLLEVVSLLRTADPESAVKLAKEIAVKLQGEKFLKSPDAGMLAINLLRIARSPARTERTPAVTNPPSKTDTTLLSEQEYRDLLQKTLAEGLSYSAPVNVYSPERVAAQNILNSLNSMTREMQGYAPGSLATVEKRIVELNTPADAQGVLWQKYQQAINTGTLEAGLEAVSQAPREIRSQLYQQLAGRAAEAGDFAGARQILKEHLSNPVHRQQALNNLDHQAINHLVAKGKIEEALRSVGNLRTSKERAMMLSEIVNQIGPGQKRATTLNLLELARSMVGAAVQAQDQEQMNALLEIGRAFSRYDSKRAFEIVEPLLDQFNDISAAAVTLNGFGQQYYEDGELITQNGNSVANVADQLSLALGNLSTANFDRAKAGADRVQRLEVRVRCYLAIAQNAISPERSEIGAISRR